MSGCDCGWDERIEAEVRDLKERERLARADAKDQAELCRSLLRENAKLRARLAYVTSMIRPMDGSVV